MEETETTTAGTPPARRMRRKSRIREITGTEMGTKTRTKATTGTKIRTKATTATAIPTTQAEARTRAES